MQQGGPAVNTHPQQQEQRPPMLQQPQQQQLASQQQQQQRSGPQALQPQVVLVPGVPPVAAGLGTAGPQSHQPASQAQWPQQQQQQQQQQLPSPAVAPAAGAAPQPLQQQQRQGRVPPFNTKKHAQVLVEQMISKLRNTIPEPSMTEQQRQHFKAAMLQQHSGQQPAATLQELLARQQQQQPMVQQQQQQRHVVQQQQQGPARQRDVQPGLPPVAAAAAGAGVPGRHVNAMPLQQTMLARPAAVAAADTQQQPAIGFPVLPLARAGGPQGGGVHPGGQVPQVQRGA